MKQVYMDYSATTPVKKEVLDAMIPFFSEHFGNPSSLYDLGQYTKQAISKAREEIAKLIGADAKEIFFTSSGTESDNWAILGTVDMLKSKGNHIITTKIEHHAVLHTCEYLEKNGYEVTYLDIDENGIVRPEDLEKAIKEETILVSIMQVNNEIGTVQPIKELAKIAKDKGVRFHTDSVQALANLHIDVKDMGVDMMSISAHKIYGPKGIGALYIKKGTRLGNFVHGGGQESRKRAGTENLTGIIGFGKAAEIASREIDTHIEYCKNLRDKFVSRVLENIPYTQLNGSLEHRHPGNANITFEFIEGEALLLFLNAKGISVSTGSACSSASLVPSHVLDALGVPVEKIHGSVRFTMGDFTTEEDVDYVFTELKGIVERLRMMSPLYSEKEHGQL